MIQPIRPSDVVKAKEKGLPDQVIQAVNGLIAKNWTGRQSKVNQGDIVAAIIGAFPDGDKLFSRQDIFNNGWLDFEPVYEAAGWRVEYDKPAYNETCEAFFIFKKKPTRG